MNTDNNTMPKVNSDGYVILEPDTIQMADRLVHAGSIDEFHRFFMVHADGSMEEVSKSSVQVVMGRDDIQVWYYESYNQLYITITAVPGHEKLFECHLCGTDQRQAWTDWATGYGNEIRYVISCPGCRMTTEYEVQVDSGVHTSKRVDYWDSFPEPYPVLEETTNEILGFNLAPGEMDLPEYEDDGPDYDREPFGPGNTPSQRS